MEAAKASTAGTIDRTRRKWGKDNASLPLERVAQLLQVRLRHIRDRDKRQSLVLPRQRAHRRRSSAKSSRRVLRAEDEERDAMRSFSDEEVRGLAGVPVD